MITSRPLLYNGYKLPDGSSVTQRMERVYFTEIYQLDSGKYLYVFLKQKIEDVASERVKSELINIHIGPETYIGLVFDELNEQFIADFQDRLSDLRGFDAIAGMEDLKQSLDNEVIGPLKHPEKYQKFKLSIPNGIMLFGPPGCGKTFIARKLAEEIGYYFVELKHSDVGSMYIHETASKIAKQFEAARIHAPSVLFIDEISGLVPKRDSLGATSQYREEEVNEFLMQLEHAASQGVLVLGATNYPAKIDNAILRSGRMDKIVFISPPDEKARELLFKIQLAGRPYEEGIDFSSLAKATDGYVSSDIELVVTKAARMAVEMESEQITEKILRDSLSQIRPSLSRDEIAAYEQYKDMERW
jgi:transitional endoplasmic reticulum ATPase